MSLETAYKQQLEWSLKMMQHPGFKGHAEHMAAKMDRGPSGLFAGIAQDLKEHMLKLSVMKENNDEA